MAYKTKNSVKGERKRGLQAVKEMEAAPGYDPHAVLALAQANLDAFGKLDDLDDASFIACMNDMRANHPDIYPVFWWWRKAEEQAGRRQEEDGEGTESRYKFFMVTQFLLDPFAIEWEDDRQTLKPGVAPWIDTPQIEAGLDHKSIKRWCWIWHDRDIYTEEDEIADRTGRIKAGDRKFKHAHIVIEVPGKVPISTIARWFKVPPQQVTILRGRGAFLDGSEYLVHESPRAVEQHKTHYDDDEVHISPGFDFRKELTDLQAHRAKFGKRSGEMTPADTMRMHVMLDGWTMKQCREDDPLTFAKIRSTLPPLRLDYLMDAPPCPFRLNIYVDGPGGIGKSAFCEYIAQAMFQSVDDPYFCIGNDERVTFDGYDGQPAIIWDDMRVTDFIHQFGSNGAYRLLDPHPRKIAEQAKHSRVILNNALNIINGVQPYEEFIAGLAGTYTDKFGTHHEAEDENQAWRRFPMILCVRENDFDVLINQGFVNNDLSSIKTMSIYSHVRGSMQAVMQRLDGAAKQKALAQFGAPVQTAAKMIEAKHDDKISDPDQIPPELMPVAESVEERFQRECAEYEERRFNTLVSFGRWFWDSPAGGWAEYTKMYPAAKVRPQEEYEFLQNLQWPTIRDAINRYVDGELVATYTEQIIRDTIEMVWNGQL